MFERVKNLFREPAPSITRQQSLSCVPVVNPNVRSDAGPGGETLLQIPRRPFLGKWLRRYVNNESPPAKILLDEMGSRVWGLVDGKRGVGEIVEQFRKDTGLHRREAETGVVEFINMLMKRGALSIVFKGEL